MFLVFSTGYPMSTLPSNKIVSLLKDIHDDVTIDSIQSMATHLGIKDPQKTQQKKAAVLIPLIERDNGLSVLLTERAQHLPNHAGQISFPGGKIESYDKSPQMTALRETQEETGLEDITLLSNLGSYTSYSGFDITTLVGLVNRPFELSPNPQEVASLIEVPLDIVMTSDAFELDFVIKEERKRSFYKLDYENNNIWGFTGTMLYLFGQYLAQIA